MATQITCQQCGQVIDRGEAPFAIRVNQIVRVICQSHIDSIPASVRRLPADSKMRSTVRINSTMQNDTKPEGLELAECRFCLSISDFKLCFPNISLNGR